MELSWLVYLRKIVVFYAQNKLKLCWMNVVFFIKKQNNIAVFFTFKSGGILEYN
jgi:hypothetical protein